jgi:hypothetical protein
MLHSKQSTFVHPMFTQYMLAACWINKWTLAKKLDFQVDIIGSMLNYRVDIGSILDCQVHWLKIGNNDSCKHIKLNCIPNYNENKNTK